MNVCNNELMRIYQTLPVSEMCGFVLCQVLENVSS